ncbi:MAG: hypothetical protein ABFS38_20990, partial [Bacteroidota bacterium]
MKIKRLKELVFISITIMVVLAMMWFLFGEKSNHGGAMIQEPLSLIQEGQAQCVIVCGTDDEYAGKRLQRWFAEEAKTDVPVVAEDELPANSTSVILIGSAGSNPLLRRISAGLEINIDPVGLTDQGYVTRTARHEERDWLILAGGGRTGAIYAVSDLMNWRLDHTGKNVSLAPVNTREIPKFKYRWFWNWDNRMDWGGRGETSITMASVKGGAPYYKSSEAFLVDTKRCVDYMADHKFNGMILWGFLRDMHGGVEASQELCRYAEQRGVRILPGVGTSGYAGFYFEGKQLYNTDTWLNAHPELRAVDKNGEFYNALCPSNKANQKWLDDGAQWMFETFDIGGLNLEMGDFLVCFCDDCKRAREAIDSDEPDYYKDMAISHKVTLESVRRLFPDAWLSYATYTGYTAEMMQEPPEFLELIPGDALCQWTLTHMAHDWPADLRPMARHNLGYLHWCNLSTNTEDDFYFEEVRDICRNAAQAGFDGLDTYGELHPERPNVELFYLAWEAFLWDPNMTIDRFVDERLGRLYGGSGPAEILLDILPLIRTFKEREDPENLAQARVLAESARDASSAEGIPRWER